MAALAELLLGSGYSVSGSDLKESAVVERLRQAGANVEIGHAAAQVQDADTVVYSAAVPDTNPELVEARTRGLEVISRAELLALVFNAGRGIGISGTHGKTTTSSMLAYSMSAAGLDPTWIIGGDLNDAGTGSRLGNSDLVVAEADEAFGSFLVLKPHIGVVTNIDADHLDFYGDFESILSAFEKFVHATSQSVILCSDDPGVGLLADRLEGDFITYGMNHGCDFQGVRVDEGILVRRRDRDLGLLKLQVPGTHNVRNAIAAVAAADAAGADPGAVLDALAGFTGVERRFSIRGERAGVTVVDDYAHHPAEVAATLQAASERYPGRRIVALFQPHLYSRTAELADRFGGAFASADLVVVTDVYAAREQPVPGVSGRIVWESIQRDAPGVTAYYAPRLTEAAGITAGLTKPGDVVLTLGAGDVTAAGAAILEHLGER